MTQNLKEKFLFFVFCALLILLVIQVIETNQLVGEIAQLKNDNQKLTNSTKKLEATVTLVKDKNYFTLISNWKPFLQQPIDQLETVFKNCKGQQEMNYTIANISFIYDAQLYILFHQFLVTLPLELQLKELEEHQTWLSDRESSVMKKHKEFLGGSIAPLECGLLSIAMTKKRITYITQKMQLIRKTN